MRSRVGAATLAGLVVVACLVIFFEPFRGTEPDPVVYPVRGIDVSHHQGPIDWKAVALSGVDFAFIKATEGRDFSDPRFEENWRGALDAGIPRGAYHFFTFCSPGVDQAGHFLRVVPVAADAVTPVADVEFGGNCSSYDDLEVVRRELRVFLDTIEQAWGRKPILYVTFRSWFQLLDDRFASFPVWFRNVYGPMPSKGLVEWVVWQYSDDSRVPGIVGPVDRNVLHPDASVESLLGVGGTGRDSRGKPPL